MTTMAIPIQIKTHEYSILFDNKSIQTHHKSIIVQMSKSNELCLLFLQSHRQHNKTNR